MEEEGFLKSDIKLSDEQDMLSLNNSFLRSKDKITGQIKDILPNLKIVNFKGFIKKASCWEIRVVFTLRDKYQHAVL